jgi:hypothetical protein
MTAVPLAQARVPDLRDGRGALAFSWELLVEQGVSSLALGSAARALAMLLERSTGKDPVVLSGVEAAALCGFEPRTWWLARRRLLALGHLVASAGGGPPSGRPGGRGHKAAYFVAPTTLERFRSAQTLMSFSECGPETVNGTVNASVFRSHHRKSSYFSKRNTLDVLKILEGRTLESARREADGAANGERNCERPLTPRELVDLLKKERSSRVRVALVKLIEWVLLLERLDRTEDRAERLKLLSSRKRPKKPGAPEPEPPRAPEAPLEKPLAARPGTETLKPGTETLKPPRGKKRSRAAQPLWAPGEGAETSEVFARLTGILTWANAEFGASFPVERSAKDACRYAFPFVRAAVANVLLKRARGYRFENPGAVLWEGITLEGYRLEEFSVGPFAAVLERVGEPVPELKRETREALPVAGPSEPSSFEAERRRRETLQAFYEQLPPSKRHEIDERAEELSQQGSKVSDSPFEVSIRALRVLSRRNELLEALVGVAGSGEATQVWESESGRDEPESAGHAPGRL